MTKDLRENIKSQLMTGTMYVNELQRKFPNNKNNFIRSYKGMVKEGILGIAKEGNRILLSLKKPEISLLFSGIMSSLPIAEQQVERQLMKLRKSKPIFRERVLRDGKKAVFRISPKNKKTLDNILQIINDLISRSVALTYAECLDLLPSNSLVLVRKYHKECIETIRKIMIKLESEDENPQSRLDMGTYLYYGINGYGHLTTLEFLSKRYSNRQ